MGKGLTIEVLVLKLVKVANRFCRQDSSGRFGPRGDVVVSHLL